jgi:hypothetical protein
VGGTDRIGSFKSNYQVITAMTAPSHNKGEKIASFIILSFAWFNSIKKIKNS